MLLKQKTNDPDVFSIEIDSMPNEINPLKNQEYNSLFVSSAMYEPLIENYNCKISIENSKCKITLEDDYNCSAKEIYRCLIYHLDIRNKSHFSKHLFNIHNAFNFFKKEIEEDKIGIEIVNDRELIIQLDIESEDFIEVITSIYIIPLNKFHEPINNGPYQMYYKNNELIKLLPNENYKDHKKLFHELVFYFNENINDSIQLYIDEKVDMTCHTQHLHTNNYLKKYDDFYTINSNLMYILYVKDKKLMKKINFSDLRENVIKHTKNNLIPLYTLSGDEQHRIRQKDFDNDYILNQSLKIAYSNYYPNNIIMEKLAYIFKCWNLEFEMSSFSHINEYVTLNRDRYDCSLHLFYPLYTGNASSIRYFINDISNNKLEIINAYNDGNKEKINQIMELTDHYIPLFKGKSQFLMNNKIKDIPITKNGLLNPKFIKRGVIKYETTKDN